MSEVLLSICIPTYNRASYLQKCLGAIFSQLDDTVRPLIEVFVSNNNSPDNTDEVVNGFIEKGFKIGYHKNEVNIGPDRNIAACFAKAKGKYAWVFSDDDFILPGYLPKIMRLLSEHDAGIFYLRSTWFKDESEIPVHHEDQLRYTVYEDNIAFFKEEHYWITFASGNIINKRSLPDTDWENQLRDTNLIQMGWMLPVIFLNRKNIIIDTMTIACKGDNSGGYDLINVFSINFNRILDEYIERKIVPYQAKAIINNNLVKTFFPYYIKPSFSGHYFKMIFTLFKLYWDKFHFYYSCLIFPIGKKIKRSIFNR